MSKTVETKVIDMEKQENEEKTFAPVEKTGVLAKIKNKTSAFSEKHPVASRRLKTVGAVVIGATAAAGLLILKGLVSNKADDSEIFTDTENDFDTADTYVEPEYVETNETTVENIE